VQRDLAAICRQRAAMPSRRTFLLGGLATAGAVGAGTTLTVGWLLVRPDRRLLTETAPPAGPPQAVPLNGWVAIGSDNAVTIVMSKAEMGQGVHTGAAMILAEELEADWSQVRVIQSPVDCLYVNRENIPHGLPIREDDKGLGAELARGVARRGARYLDTMITGGSTSIIDLWGPMREAGASARIMLCAAAARQWHVAPDRCVAKAGRILNMATGESATFGSLVDAARGVPYPDVSVVQASLKTEAFTLIGSRVKRIEATPKLDGSTRFGIDVTASDLPPAKPGDPPVKLLYASVMMCPTLGGRLRSYDKAKLDGAPGVRAHCALEPFHGGTGGVAVIADNPFIAMRALCDLPVEWIDGDAAAWSTANVRDTLRKALDDTSGSKFYETGDVDVGLKQGHKVLHREYEVPYLAHAALEPANCTVRIDGKTATVWVSTQIPRFARVAVAKVLGLKEKDVTIHERLIGGAFGRRLEVDFIAQAAFIASQVGGTAVQTIWSRPQDTAHDFYRPACVSRLSGALDADGRLVAWRAVSASQSVTEQVVERTYGYPAVFARHLPDATMAEGAFDQPYECPNILVRHTRVRLPIPVGYWRSVGHSHQAFFVESFMDEMAVAAGKDPIDFRLALLTHHPHHTDVLNRLIEISDWRRKPMKWKDKEGREFARGMAMHESFGSIVAQVADVRLDTADCYRVTDVFCVIDCGLAVNPNLVEQQMESGIIFGLSAALEQQVTLRNGRVQQHYYSEVPLINMKTCPTIRTSVMASGKEPKGVGEAGPPPIAPAVANAVFRLTGCRPTGLPLVTPPVIFDGEEDWEGDRWCKWCKSLSTGNPSISSPTRTLPCSGCSAANSA